MLVVAFQERFAKEKECSAVSDKLKVRQHHAVVHRFWSVCCHGRFCNFLHTQLAEEEYQRLKKEHEELLRQQKAMKQGIDQKIGLARDSHREIGDKLSELLALHQAASSSLEL